MLPASVRVVTPARQVRGRVVVPGDKSLSHRYALLAAIAEGLTRIEHYAPGADCVATLDCLEHLGVEIRHGEEDSASVEIRGRGLRGLAAPLGMLDAANSGTTMRLLTGVLAAHPFESMITGDRSLRRRPMRRVIAPLERMGARVRSADGRPPLVITGAELHGIDYSLPVPSAQVKSAVLLAGLQANGRTVVRETAQTRDHTERTLTAFGAHVEVRDRLIALAGGQRLQGTFLRVPGDISSAAYWAVAAAALPGSDVELVDVGLNPTRTAFLDVLRRAGADVQAQVAHQEAGEPIGTVRVRHGTLGSVVVTPAEVPALIDELPALAALATHGGEISVSGASELRVKESDRIAALVRGLRALGADADELPDGFHVRAGHQLAGGMADAAGDHRLAMALAIAALGASAPSRIRGAEAVVISYPGFFETLHLIAGGHG